MEYPTLIFKGQETIYSDPKSFGLCHAYSLNNELCIYLDFINVASRKQGNGTQIMSAIIRYASCLAKDCQQANIKVFLEVDYNSLGFYEKFCSRNNLDLIPCINYFNRDFDNCYYIEVTHSYILIYES